MHDPPTKPNLDALLEHGGWVRALARSLMADPTAAEDLEQKVWLAALERPPGHLSNSRAWLSTVVRNIAGMHWRKEKARRHREDLFGEKRWQEDVDGSSNTTPDCLAERMETFRKLATAMVNLAEPFGTTLYLRFFEELTVREISQRMEVPESTAKKRIARGLQLLRFQLEASIGQDWRQSCLVFTVPLATFPTAAITTALTMTLKTKLFVAAASLAFVSLLFVEPWNMPWSSNGATDPGLAAQESIDGVAQAEFSMRPSLNTQVQTLATDVVRETLAPAISTITITDWLGDRVMHGKIYFCDDSETRLTAFSNGRAIIPSFDWTHVLVVIQNHSPHLFGRDSIESSERPNDIQMPSPTFAAQVSTEGPSWTDIQLAVDYPWVDTGTWPQSLKKNFLIPTEIPLHIDSKSHTTYFVGVSPSSTTISCRSDILIEEGDRLSKAVQYSHNSLNERVVLHDFPLLTIRAQLGPGFPLESLCDVSVTLKEIGLGEHRISGQTDLSRDWKWSKPYDPAYTMAYVAVTDKVSGYEVGSAEIELTGHDQEEVIELSQRMLSISVLDESGIGVPGAVIVQAKSTLAITDSSGYAEIDINLDAGKIWILSRPHDAKSISPEALVATPVVLLNSATGVVFQCNLSNRGPLFQEDILLEVDGLSYSAALWEAPIQASQVYGFSVYYAELMEMDWSVFLGADAGEIEVVGSSYVFGVKPSDQLQGNIQLAGIFDIEKETIAQVTLFDGHQQEAWHGSVPVLPNELATITLNFDDLFRTISIRVVREDGTPLVDANVSTGPFIGFFPSPTNSDGTATLLVSQKDDVLLQVEATGFVSRKFLYPPSISTDLIQMTPARQLRIQVVDKEGNRVDVKLELHDGDSQWHGDTKAQGVFQFKDVPQKTLRARIVSNGTDIEYEVPSMVETYTLTYPY